MKRRVGIYSDGGQGPHFYNVQMKTMRSQLNKEFTPGKQWVKWPRCVRARHVHAKQNRPVWPESWEQGQEGTETRLESRSGSRWCHVLGHTKKFQFPKCKGEVAEAFQLRPWCLCFLHLLSGLFQASDLHVLGCEKRSLNSLAVFTITNRKGNLLFYY